MAEFAQRPSSEARFEETKTIGLLTSPLVLEGLLTFRTPDYLKKQIISPTQSLFEINGNQAVVETEEGKHTFALDTYPPLYGLVESFRATLAGDRKALEKNYQVELTGARSQWILRLIPKNEEISSRIKRITITGSTNDIQSVETLEISGDTSVMTIYPGDDTAQTPRN